VCAIYWRQQSVKPACGNGRPWIHGRGTVQRRANPPEVRRLHGDGQLTIEVIEPALVVAMSIKYPG
jgi:hypothetical protein